MSQGAFETLGGAFLAAGSRAVIASLWDVEDQATEALFRRFYWHFGRGDSAAESLRAAQDALRNDPRYDKAQDWAGWVLAGEDLSLPQQVLKSRPASPWPFMSPFHRWVLIVVALVVFAGTAFLLVRRLGL